MSFDWEFDDAQGYMDDGKLDEPEFTIEDFDEEVAMHRPKRVKTTGDAVQHALLTGTGISTHWLVSDPTVLVTLAVETCARRCEHCGKEHYQLIVQTIAARGTGEGRGSKFVEQALAALPARYALCGRIINQRMPELPFGLCLQSVTTTASVKLAKRFGMAIVKSSAFGPNGEYGDYHVCTHKQ